MIDYSVTQWFVHRQGEPGLPGQRRIGHRELGEAQHKNRKACFIK
jgi:hypothetical protein